MNLYLFSWHSVILRLFQAGAVQRLWAPAPNVGVPRAFVQPCLMGQSVVARCEVNIGVCACDASLRNIYRVTGWSLSICQPRNTVKMAIIIKSSSFQHFSIVFWGTASPLHTVLLKTDHFSSKHVQTHTDKQSHDQAEVTNTDTYTHAI